MSHLTLGYLDAGSGSMILQVIAGGVAAAAVSAKLFWRRLLVMLRIHKPEEESALAAERTPPSDAL